MEGTELFVPYIVFLEKAQLPLKHGCFWISRPEYSGQVYRCEGSSEMAAA